MEIDSEIIYYEKLFNTGQPKEILTLVCPVCFCSTKYFIYKLNELHHLTCKDCRENFILNRQINTLFDFNKRKSYPKSTIIKHELE